MTYFKHLAKNWRVSAHATKDAFAHFIHGLLPFIKIKHHQPTEAAPIFKNKNNLCVTCKHGDTCKFSTKIFSSFSTSKCYLYEEKEAENHDKAF